MVVGTAVSIVSFLFLSQAIRKHGLRGVLFLDAAEEEVTELQEDYDAIIEVIFVLQRVLKLGGWGGSCSHKLGAFDFLPIYDRNLIYNVTNVSPTFICSKAGWF